MYLYFYRLIRGYLWVEIEGLSLERFLNMCIHHKIRIWNVTTSRQKYSFCIMRQDFKKLPPLSKKTKTQIRIIDRIGLPVILFRHRKRKLFIAGIFTCLFTLFILSQYIWNINVSGNQYYTEDTIISYLNENQIQIAMKADQINSEEITAMLRAEYEYIVWASVHVEGCQLIIKIKENDQITATSLEMEHEQKETDNSESYGTDIVAETNGIITSIVTRSGVPMVHIGDEVEEGDVLISGRLEVYADYDELIGYQYVESDGDVWIQSSVDYQDAISLTYMEKLYLDEYRRSICIVFNSNYIEVELWNPLTVLQSKFNDILTDDTVQVLNDMDANVLYDTTATIIEIDPKQQEYLKFHVNLITYSNYELIEAVYNEEEAQEILNTNYQLYCSELNEKKVEILGNNVKITIKENTARAEGSLDMVWLNEKTAVTEVLEEPSTEPEEGLNE